MIPVTTYCGRSVALFGLGGSGLVTARALAAGGATVTAFDDNPEQVARAEQEGVKTRNLQHEDFDGFDALVLAPGVPLTHPKPHWTVHKAKAAGIPIVGDIELFAAERRAKAPSSTFIAITGTNGKSTTTALIAHILQSAGRETVMGGNIGTAILSAPGLSDRAFYVVECSSYQIDLAPSLDPTIGILLNLAADHLERHGTMENYAGIKERLVANSAHAIVGMDDDYTAGVAAYLSSGKREVYRISTTGPVKPRGVEYTQGSLINHNRHLAHAVARLEGIVSLRGTHNGQNAAAAWQACHLAGLTETEIQDGLASFPGLAHRMELVATCGTVLFVNDSKATNADAASVALDSFDHIYWIAGGLPKAGGIESLKRHFPKITKAYLVGEAGPSFAAVLGDAVPYEISGTLDAAVERASQDASKDTADEAVVLLSPACASFDQFPNFEMRGEAFRAAVGRLKGINMAKEAS